MNGSKILLDTNIVLFLINRDDVLAELIDNKIPYVSFITEMELLSYDKYSATDLLNIKSFLDDCHIVDMNSSIKQIAIKIRKTFKLKLPDSIIAATTEYLKIPMLTADADFNKLKSLRILQYKKQ
jgi:predicted nucleic acid-binding protein